MANAWLLRPLPIVSASASSTASGSDPAYVDNDHLGVVWRSGATAAPHIDVDLGADLAVDAALLLGLTDAATDWMLSVKAATAAQGATFPGGSYSGAAQQLLAGDVMPTSGRGIGLWAPGDLPPAGRHLRFTIDQGDTAPVTIGRLAVGKRIVLSRNFVFGAALGVRDLGKLDFSRRGAILRSRGAKLRTVGIKFAAARRQEVEEAILPLIEAAGNTEPVALVIDPATHEQRQRRIHFGFLVGDLQAIWARSDGFEWSVNLVSMV